MKLLVGLGNPGKKYKNNRHNVGHMFTEYAVNGLTGSRVNELKIVKTDCYMNLSGEFVKKLIRNSHFAIDNLIIAHDDLDIPLGKFKIQKGTGPQLHNGVSSIENALSRKDFWRVRIGIDNRKPDNYTDGEAYVLSDFTDEELKTLGQIFPEINKRLLYI